MANYDATGLKNAVIYTFNTAVKEAGLEPRDFKLNSIKVNRENRISGGYEYNATLDFSLVNDEYTIDTERSNSDTKIKFYDIPTEQDIPQDYFMNKGDYQRILRFMKEVVTTPSNIRNRAQSQSEIKEIVDMTVKQMERKNNCSLEYDVSFNRSSVEVLVSFTDISVDGYNLHRRSDGWGSRDRALYFDAGEFNRFGPDSGARIYCPSFDETYQTAEIRSFSKDLEEFIKSSRSRISGDIKKLFDDFEEYEEMEEDVDSICDEIESIADKMRISDCEVTYTIQGNTNKGIPYFSIKVKVNGRLLCSYGIEPGEDMDRKRTSIMRSVKRYFDRVGGTDYIEL